MSPFYWGGGAINQVCFWIIVHESRKLMIPVKKKGPSKTHPLPVNIWGSLVQGNDLLRYQADKTAKTKHAHLFSKNLFVNNGQFV